MLRWKSWLVVVLLGVWCDMLITKRKQDEKKKKKKKKKKDVFPCSN